MVIESIRTLPESNPNQVTLQNVSSREEGEFYQSIRDSNKSYIENDEINGIESMLKK